MGWAGGSAPSASGLGAHPTLQNKGRLAGTPSRRGKRSGHGRAWWSTWYSKPSRTAATGSRPNWASWSLGQRRPGSAAPSVEPTSGGGSETTIQAPTRSRGAPHSATTAGGTEGAGQEAVKGSAPFLLPPRFLRPLVKNPDPVLEPRRSTAARRNLARRPLASKSTRWTSGQSGGHRQPGQTATRAQIDQEGLREASLRGQAAAHGGEALGVL